MIFADRTSSLISDLSCLTICVCSLFIMEKLERIILNDLILTDFLVF